MTATGFYETDLAWIHHTGYRAVPEAAAGALLEELARGTTPDGAVLDLGCGSGVFGAALAGGSDRDYIGVDLSPAFLALARATRPDGTYLQDSMHRVTLPPAAVVTMIGESLNYVPGSGRRPDPERLLRRIAAHLPLHGLLLFDVITDAPAARAGNLARGFTLAEDWATLASLHPTGSTDVFERRITLFRRPPGAAAAEWRRTDETHRFRVLDRAGLTRLLRDAGFSVRVRKGWSTESTLPGRSAFICRKRRDR